MFSRAVTKASTLKQRAKDAYKARRKNLPREQSVDQLLANAPLFASLSLDERAELADQCIVAEFRKGEVISQMGDYSDQMCLVARGAVRLSVEGTEVAAVEPDDPTGSAGAATSSSQPAAESGFQVGDSIEARAMVAVRREPKLKRTPQQRL